MLFRIVEENVYVPIPMPETGTLIVIVAWFIPIEYLTD